MFLINLHTRYICFKRYKNIKDYIKNVKVRVSKNKKIINFAYLLSFQYINLIYGISFLTHVTTQKSCYHIEE